MLGFYSTTLAEKILAESPLLPPLLPWTVTLREIEANRTEISAPDPAAMLVSVDAPPAVAQALRQALQSVILGPHGGDTNQRHTREAPEVSQARASVTAS